MKNISFQNPFKNGQTRLMLLLIFNTALFVAIYFTVPVLTRFVYLPVIYLAVGGGLMLWFVFYNRGFSLRNAKPEDLPDTLSRAEKEEKIAEAKARFQRSRWALTIVIPILLTFFFDMIYLVFGDTVAGWFA